MPKSSSDMRLLLTPATPLCSWFRQVTTTITLATPLYYDFGADSVTFILILFVSDGWHIVVLSTCVLRWIWFCLCVFTSLYCIERRRWIMFVHEKHVSLSLIPFCSFFFCFFPIYVIGCHYWTQWDQWLSWFRLWLPNPHDLDLLLGGHTTFFSVVFCTIFYCFFIYFNQIIFVNFLAWSI